MISKTIKYTDYNGDEREEKFLFNLSEAELIEMEMGTTGGLAEKIKKIVETKDAPQIVKIFKELILKSYGEKSEDGKRFIKVDESGVPLSVGFSQTEAYSKLFVELSTNAEEASKFVNGIIPTNISAQNQQK